MKIQELIIDQSNARSCWEIYFTVRGLEPLTATEWYEVSHALEDLVEEKIESRKYKKA